MAFNNAFRRVFLTLTCCGIWWKLLIRKGCVYAYPYGQPRMLLYGKDAWQKFLEGGYTSCLRCQHCGYLHLYKKSEAPRPLPANAWIQDSTRGGPLEYGTGCDKCHKSTNQRCDRTFLPDVKGIGLLNRLLFRIGSILRIIEE